MANFLYRLRTSLLRIVLMLFGLMMFFGVMLIGAVVSIIVIVWALLRGRKGAPLNFSWKGPVDWRTGGFRSPASKSAEAEVVDIEAREIEPTAAKIEKGEPRSDRMVD